MSTITPLYRSVKDLLQSQSFCIDEYQREYKWEEKNIVELVSDLLEKFQSCYSPKDLTADVSNYENYFLGSIIVSKRNGKNYLIDGQQRVTSLTLLLIYLFRESKIRNLGLDTELAPLIFSSNYGTQKFNLDIPERLPVIEALFKGEAFSPDGKEESIQTMYLRYQDIERQGLADELGDSMPHFIYWLMNKVGLIEISTDNDNYAYSIFETMNDRGKPLSPVDMLKAYLLAPIGDADKRKSANQLWKGQVLNLLTWGDEQENERDATCIKAWFRAQYAETIRERKAGAGDKDWELIGTTFHRWARDNAPRIGLGSEVNNLKLINNDFKYFSGAFLKILDASKNYTAGMKSIFYNAHNEFTWQNTVLLAPLVVSDDEETTIKKMELVAIYLDIWLMRRVVNYVRVGYSAVNYAMWLLCRDIRNKSTSELRNILHDKLKKDDFSFDGHEAKNREGIDDLRLNQFSRRYIYHILARITSFVEEQSGRNDLFDKYVDREGKNSLDIEHIWADNYLPYKDQFDSQDEFQRSRNHIAGLLLLPADMNRSYQDKPFVEKSPHYAKANMYAASLNRSAYEHQPQFSLFIEKNNLRFEPYSVYGKAEQDARRVLIKQLVKMIWSPERLLA
jgi:uncharacterized protein with ParB-like and HNH nuclease domain